MSGTLGLGVPGNPGDGGREKGGSGQIIPGQKKIPNGVKFFEGSAQNDPGARVGVGKPAPGSESSLNAPSRPGPSKGNKDTIKGTGMIKS